MSTAPKPLTIAALRLLSDGDFHSGEVLAQQLGVSRASIHHALRDAADFGLELFSVRGRGYSLRNPPEWLEPQRIQAELGGLASELQLQVVDATDSTNTRLLQQAAQGARSGTVLAAEWQSGGRGRFGRRWHAGLGQALTFSLLWRFGCGLNGLSGLSLAVGVALVRVLRELGIAQAGLKWPNDVLDERGKLAGILIEAQGDVLGPSAVVIGVGINLRLPETGQIDQPVGALAREGVTLPERNRLFALILMALTDTLRAFGQSGFAGMRPEWERYHVWQDRPVRLLMPNGQSLDGVVRGVTDEGGLRLETELGEQIVNSGEVSLRVRACC